MNFELFRSERDGQFYFRLCDKAGTICLKSEGYRRKQSCRKGMESVRRNGGDETKYNIRFSKKKMYYFILKARNGQIIGSGPFLPDE